VSELASEPSPQGDRDRPLGACEERSVAGWPAACVKAADAKPAEIDTIFSTPRANAA
jgi:hypothetical protein